MSNSKYDWATHMPRMLDLYRSEMSIPDIHKAIQNVADGFTPGLRIVYSKFNAEGYPTNQAGRAQCLKLLNIARWPAEVSTNIRLPNRRLLPAVSNALSHDAPADRSPSSIKLTHNNGIIRTQLNEANNTIDTDSFLWTDPPPIPDDLQVGSSSIFLSVDESFENPLPSNPPSVGAYQGQHDGQWEFVGLDPQENFDIQSLAPGAYSTSSQIPEAISQMETHNDILSVHSDILSQRNVTPLLYDESPRSISLADKCKFQPLADSPSPCSQLVLPPSPRYSGSARGSKVDGRNSSWRPKPKYNRSCTPEKRSSTSTSDSGYASGRSSPFPPVPEANNLHPQSLSEFGGLHRIPCQNLHEPSPYNEIYTPQSQTRFKDTLTCSQCLYSSIHNLSWSARYLNLEVFKKKLTNTKMEFERQGIYNLDVLYDVTALDATGNSALHYAAAGGAGFEHFTSLIQIGVSPYQLNTAGQLFLHCWQPHLQKSKQNAISGDFIALFNADLVNLLNHFQPTGAFRWRDNEGKTVLDSLACVLTHEIKEQTFRLVTNAGYPLEISSQFDHCPKDPNRLSHQSSSPDTLRSAPSQYLDKGHDSDFSSKQERQIKAWGFLQYAATEPSYVDSQTGDNVLHALSRLKFPHTASLISKIQSFISEDVDLNLRNKERDCPLASFIQERPFSDETGATMSKYLDALLWKDSRNRIPNKINVNMRNREGATALYYAAIRARPDSVRSLIEAGANVNARLARGAHHISILQATFNARAAAVVQNDAIKIHQFKNVISYLEHENAVIDPTVLEERELCPNSVRILPM